MQTLTKILLTIFILFSILFCSCTFSVNHKDSESIEFMTQLADLKFKMLEKSWNYELLKKFDDKYRSIDAFKKNTDSVIAYSKSTNNMNDAGISLCEKQFSDCWNTFYANDSLHKPQKINLSNIEEFISSVRLYQFLIVDKVLYECNKQKFYNDSYDVLVVPNRGKIKRNETFFADIYLVGHNTMFNPDIIIGKDTSDVSKFFNVSIEKGVGKLSIPATNKSGVQEWSGFYYTRKSYETRIIRFPFKIKYEVE